MYPPRSPPLPLDICAICHHLTKTCMIRVNASVFFRGKEKEQVVGVTVEKKAEVIGWLRLRSHRNLSVIHVFESNRQAAAMPLALNSFYYSHLYKSNSLPSSDTIRHKIPTHTSIAKDQGISYPPPLSSIPNPFVLVVCTRRYTRMTPWSRTPCCHQGSSGIKTDRRHSKLLLP